MNILKIITHLFIIISIILQARSQGIKNVYFAKGSNIMTNDTDQRDGTVIITLNTNENTTICNYKFDDITAGIVCKTLGFPAQGMSITGNHSRETGPVLLANFQCNGFESSLVYCKNSGRQIQRRVCATHAMDAHVFCLFPKVPSVVSPVSVNTVCNKTSPIYSLTPEAGKKNIGILTVNNNYVCNDDYSFEAPAANFVCNELCYNSSNPKAIMPYSNIPASANTSLRLACTTTGCTSSLTIPCFNKALIIGIQCGEEPQVIEQSPFILCTIGNMTLTWPAGFSPPINSNLISLNTPCAAAITNTVNNVTTMRVPFDSCNPTLRGDQKYVNFSYIIKRAYQPIGSVTPPPKLLLVVCSFEKTGKDNNTFGFDVATYRPLSSITKFEFQMKFFSDNSYLTEILPNGFVNSDKKLYVSVTVLNPTSDVSLTLTQCNGTTTNNINIIDSSNSVTLIDKVCPSQIYDVIISPFSKTEVRFSFTPYALTSSPNQTIYVICRTSLCHLKRDGFCPLCGGSRRKKRSINLDLEEYLVEGFLNLSD